jgi:hypothetical protein
MDCGLSSRAAGGGGREYERACWHQEFAPLWTRPSIVGKQIFEPGKPMAIVGMVSHVRTRSRNDGDSRGLLIVYTV